MGRVGVKLGIRAQRGIIVAGEQVWEYEEPTAAVMGANSHTLWERWCLLTEGIIGGEMD